MRMMCDELDFNFRFDKVGSEDNERAAYLDGKRAFRRGGSLEDNPYTEDNFEFLFNAGYHYEQKYPETQQDTSL